MAAHLAMPTSAGWAAIRREVAKMLRPHLAYHHRMLVFTMTILCPVAALLYAISAVKRSKNIWLFRIEPDGYIRPNIHIVTPLLVVLYTAVNLAALISLQTDLYDTVTHPRTPVLNSCTFPILIWLAWTKLWTVLFAMPPSKYVLLRRQNGNRSQTSRFLSAKVMNTLGIFSYIFPVAFSLPLTIMVSHEVSQINVCWHTFNAATKTIMNANANVTLVNQANLEAMQNLNRLKDHGNKLLLLTRVTAGGYNFMNTFLLFGLGFSYFRILRALWFQVNILRQTAKRRQDTALDFFCQYAHDPDSSIKALDDSGRSVERFGASTAASVEVPPSGHQIITVALTDKWGHWLPHLKPGSEVDYKLWQSSLFTPAKHEWEVTDERILIEQYRVLRRYTTNTLWQAGITCLITSSCVVLGWFIVTNAWDVPTKHSLAELTYRIILWCNLSWNLGIGILMGVISCVVAFSAVPQLPQEPAQIIDNFDD